MKKELSESKIKNGISEVTVEKIPTKGDVSKIADIPSIMNSARHGRNPSMTVECNICFSQKANAIISECGHGGICYECGFKLLKSSHLCPFCRQKVVAVYKVEKTDTTFIMQASDAAVYISPGCDKDKIFKEILNKGLENS